MKWPIMTKSQYKKIYIVLGVLSILSLLAGTVGEAQVGLSLWMFRTLWLVFTLSVFLFYKITVGEFKIDSFNDLLWKTLVTSIVIVVLFTTNELLIRWMGMFLSYDNQTIRSLAYSLIMATAIVYGSNIYFTFKKMVLYQKSKELSNLWMVFEWLVFGSIFISFFPLNNTDILFQIASVPIAAMGVMLALNLKWIAYLNFKQKLRSIIFLFILLIFSLLFVIFIFGYSKEYTPPLDLAHNFFVINLFLFGMVYTIFSILVLVFNLPTSSVFEQKFDEIINLQKLSRSIQINTSEEEVYELLLNSCAGTFIASAAALEMYDKEVSNKVNYTFNNCTKDQLFEIKTMLRKNNLRVDSEALLLEEFKQLKTPPVREAFPYRSMLSIPLTSYGEKLGQIYLFSEVKNGFDNQLMDIVTTYVNQASIAISNFRLVSQAVSNARYKEELKIARRVQEKLLPKIETKGLPLEVVTFSESASEVGGDYFDYALLPDNKIAFVIGDVSGRGTSAAFQMAELKGVFQSLIINYKSNADFIQKANQVLAICLDKNSFVTLTLLVIDMDISLLTSSIAGHCPTVLYRTVDKQVLLDDTRGMGLGVVRSAKYNQFIKSTETYLHQHDILFLFTDGILEARNPQKELFGQDRIKEFFMHYGHLSLEDMKNKFVQELHAFCKNEQLTDDHTFMIIKYLGPTAP